MKYLEDTLKIKVRYQDNVDISGLQNFLIFEYELKYAYLNEVKCLFIRLKNQKSNFKWQQVKRHIKIFNDRYNVPVVIIFNNLNSYERNILLSNYQPFICVNKQIYLPFLGVVLQEQYTKQNKKKASPLTQLIFLYFIYASTNECYLDSINNIMPYSSMSISRAFKELEEFEGIEAKKNGVKKYIFTKLDKKNLFENNRNKLIYPIRNKIYISKETINDLDNISLIISGETALSNYSMLNTPVLNTYATKINVKKINQYETDLFDSDKQCCLEI